MEKKQNKACRITFAEDLARLTAADIMIPRSSTVLLSTRDSFDHLIETIIADGHSRFPVYSDQVDNILGILYVKDLLTFFRNPPDKFDITTLLRQPIFVSENKKASELFAEFRESHIHMGIVVDEYGTMLGIITLEDILEELVGDISDEYDKDEDKAFHHINRNESIIQPRLEISEFNRIFKTRITCEEYDTIGGYILDHFGYVPATGEKLEIGNLELEVQEVSGSRIGKILVRKQ